MDWQRRLEDMTVVDTDIHSTEQAPDLFPYIEDDEIRKREENGYVNRPRAKGPYGADGWNVAAGGRDRFEGKDLFVDEVQRLADIREHHDRIGADKMLIAPGMGMKTHYIQDLTLRKEYLKAVNNYLFDRFHDPADETHYNTVLVVPDHPEESARLVREHGGKDKVRAVFTSSMMQFPFGHDRYEPVLEAAEEQGLPIVLHGNPSIDPTFPNGSMRMGSFMEHHIMGSPVSYMRHATSLVGQEIVERYDIDFCFWEGGISWMQTLITRMDDWYHRRPFDAPGLARQPSDYLQNMYINTNPIEPTLEPDHLQTIIDINRLEDSICYASDFPHKHLDALEEFATHEGLSWEMKRKILQDNPARLFGF